MDDFRGFADQLLPLGRCAVRRESVRVVPMYEDPNRGETQWASSIANKANGVTLNNSKQRWVEARARYRPNLSSPSRINFSIRNAHQNSAWN